jgi:hypothetical protein
MSAHPVGLVQLPVFGGEYTPWIGPTMFLVHSPSWPTLLLHRFSKCQCPRNVHCIDLKWCLGLGA